MKELEKIIAGLCTVCSMLYFSDETLAKSLDDLISELEEVYGKQSGVR